jgi:hypothetical protein
MPRIREFDFFESIYENFAVYVVHRDGKNLVFGVAEDTGARRPSAGRSSIPKRSPTATGACDGALQ